MELDDLRQRWQQTAPIEAPPLQKPAFDELLARRSRSPIAKLRRNAWLEIGVVALCLVGTIGMAAATSDSYYVVMATWIALICLLSGFYFRRKLALLRRLGEAGNGTVREYMKQQLHSLRGLVRLYYRATMWSVPVSLGIAIIALAVRFEQPLHGPKAWIGLSILGGFFLTFGAALLFSLRYFTRWWLQRLYGQHLDHLESSLRELDEPEP